MNTKLLIFGITGVLSERRLLPALDKIIGSNKFQDLSIIGVTRSDINVADFLLKFGRPMNLKNKLTMFSMDVGNAEEYKRLKEFIDLKEDEQLLVYLALPPKVVADVVDKIGLSGLSTSNVKILFEKPFGVDIESAKDITRRANVYFNEEQIYRIDHYLAKEMAQNIVAFRSKNAIFSSIWNNNFIESIEITNTESIGIEGRASFYEQTGALRDIAQGHLMQLLALTLMNTPQGFGWDDMPKNRLMALSHIKEANTNKVIRAQYDTYKNEVNNQNSKVETFVSMGLESNQPEWLGVPIKLVTGKALDKKTTEIRVSFKKVCDTMGNCLVFRVQPNEGVDIELFVKKPGYDQEFEVRHLGFSYGENDILPDAYEQVIVDAISSRKSLFTSGDEVLQSWRILQQIQDNWQSSSDAIPIYATGSKIEQITPVSSVE